MKSFIKTVKLLRCLSQRGLELWKGIVLSFNIITFWKNCDLLEQNCATHCARWNTLFLCYSRQIGKLRHWFLCCSWSECAVYWILTSVRFLAIILCCHTLGHDSVLFFGQKIQSKWRLSINELKTNIWYQRPLHNGNLTKFTIHQNWGAKWAHQKSCYPSAATFDQSHQKRTESTLWSINNMRMSIWKIGNI